MGNRIPDYLLRRHENDTPEQFEHFLMNWRAERDWERFAKRLENAEPRDACREDGGSARSRASEEAMTWPINWTELRSVEWCRECGREPLFMKVVDHTYVALVDHTDNCPTRIT